MSGDASRERNKKTGERRCVYLDLQLDRNSAVILQSTMKRKSGKKENPLFVDSTKRTQNIRTNNDEELRKRMKMRAYE